jgi:CubicO group peptidase (beta-lactamase class C family)
MRIQRRRKIIQGVVLGTMLLVSACGSQASNEPPVELAAEATVTVATSAPAPIPAQPVATATVVEVITGTAPIEVSPETGTEMVTAVDFAPLIATIEAEMAAQQVPGLAVAIVQKGEIIFAQGFGVAEVATDRAVTAATSFRIGSITKPLTAIALMQLVAAGKVALDAPVVSYLPEFQVSDQITVRQLLSHSSGLGDAAIPYGRTDLAALEDYVASLSPASAFVPPGTLFSYSNPGFNTLGRIIEVVSGMPYANYMDSEVFPALGMTHTTFARDVAVANELAVGYYPARGAPAPVERDPDNAAEYPSGFAFSTVEDLARLALFLLADGVVDGQAVLQPASVQAMKTPVVKVEPLGIGYGLGLMMRTLGEETLVGHNGTINGYTASLEMLPSQDLAVIVLTNRNNYAPTRITQAAFELVGNLPHTVPAAPVTLDDATLTEYAGSYLMSSALPEQPAEIMVVEVQEGRLTASLPGVTFELRPIGTDLFDLYVPNEAEPVTQLAFVRDVSGSVHYMSFTMHALLRVEQ